MLNRLNKTFIHSSHLQFQRLNSTLRSIPEILTDVPRYFTDSSDISCKIAALQTIAPKTTEYTDFTPNTITIGILQSKDLKPGLFLNSLITDPLSSDNKCVDLLNQHRSLHPNSNIKVLYGNIDKHIRGGCYLSKSSMLSSEFRLIQDAKLNDGSSKLLNRDIFNNISFIEINDPSFSRNEKAEGAEELTLNTVQKDDEIKETELHNMIYVKSDTNGINKINDLPYFEVINGSSTTTNVGTSLKENLKENTFRIDLEKLEKGNNLIAESIQNISEYLTLYEESNMNELLYTINRETSGYKPLILLLRGLIRDLENDQAVLENDTQTKLKQEIQDWSQKAHFELQSKVTPFLENVLVKELSKFSQLVYNSGDLTLVVSNLLNGSRVKVKTGLLKEPIECYGSLEDSIAQSYYLEGKIDVAIPTESIRGSQTDKFIEELKRDVSNEKIPELQSKINSLLIKEIIAAPLTIFTVSNIGYIYDLISLNTTFALTALTIALAANTSQKKFINLINQFKDWYLEQLRLYIEKTTSSLSHQLKGNIEDFTHTNIKKGELIDELRGSLKEIEKADASLKKVL